MRVSFLILHWQLTINLNAMVGEGFRFNIKIAEELKESYAERMKKYNKPKIKRSFANPIKKT